MRSVALCSVLTGLAVVASCGRKNVSGSAVDPVFRPLIAADTKALAGADLQKLENTPFYRKHESALTFPMLDSASEHIGLDPRRDLTELLITWNGKQPLFLARGRFSQDVVQRKLTALGARGSTYRQFSLLTFGEDSVTLLKHSLIVAGPVASVRGALDTESSGEGAVPEELEERLRSVPKRDQIWEVSRGGLPFAEVPMRSEYSSALSNIVGYVEGTSFGIEFDTGAHLSATLSCTSQQGAQRVHDGLRAAIALGRLTTKDDQPDLLRIYDAIHVDRNNQLVEVNADFPADLADRLANYLTNLKSGFGPARR